MNRLLLTAVVAAAFAAAATTRAADKKTGDAHTSDGFVQLFNGRDLTGWKSPAESKTKWEVTDGAMTGNGPPGHLFSERGDYENFVYRMEIKINDKGNSG